MAAVTKRAGAASPQPAPGQCAYFVARKRRFCKLVPAQGRRFCGEHGDQEDENSRRRIPCPLDPKHTVYEDQLQQHMKKCNSREKPKPVYFAEDINAGLKDRTELLADQDQAQVLLHYIKLLGCNYNTKRLKEHQEVPISALSKEELEDLIRKLRRATNGIKTVLKDEMLSHRALEAALNEPNNGDAALKHLKQQASILGNMERLHLLGPGRCFVEFGAGRGKLSHWVDLAIPDATDVHFLLVERATTRFKVDGKHRKNGFERLQVDIQHLCLNQVPVLVKEKQPVVGIGKHVCGAATDLALRCLVETYANSCDDEEESSPAKHFKSDGSGLSVNNSTDEMHGTSITDKWSPIAGIVLALCCHHRCDWKHYVGRDFFATVGLGTKEFNYFRRMTSWATCGMRETERKASLPDTCDNEHTFEAQGRDQDDRGAESSLDSLPTLLTIEERKEIGRLCKLLIDHGRIEYLQHRGYDARLQCYTDLSVSLENVLLTAVPHLAPSLPSAV